MPHYTDYRCGVCNKDFNDDPDPTSKLVRKVVQFQRMGERKKVERSRTVMFECYPCMHLDADYNVSSHETPGMRSPARERVRAAERAERGDEPGQVEAGI